MHFDKYDYTKEDIILLAAELQKMNMPFKIIEKNNNKRVKLQRL
jgi:hypothetical protein